MEMQLVADRRPLDLDPRQLAWHVRLWQLVARNYRTAYDYGRFEKEKCKEDSADVLGCAFQRLNLRLMSVALFLGQLVQSLNVEEMLQIIQQFESSTHAVPQAIGT